MLPPDADKLLVTCNPLMLAMMVAVFDLRRGLKMPKTTAELYQTAADAMLKRGEAADAINEIDRIVGTGFNWGPPSVLVDTMTPAGATRLIEEAGLPVPQALAAIGTEAGPTFQHPHINIGKFFVAG